MLYQGEGIPRGYEYPPPDTKGGNSIRSEGGPHPQLPNEILDRISRTVRTDQERAEKK